MTDGKGSDSQDEALADDAKRPVEDDDAGAVLETPEPVSEVATVLVDEDDRTQLVMRAATEEDENPSQEFIATRVLDSPDPSVIDDDPAERPGETRALETTDDKTSPPSVASDPVGSPNAEAAMPQPRQAPPPTPIDNSRGLIPGTVLFGEYEIINVLGVGGMGEVYRARHRRLEEHRAIKVMHADLSQKKGASEFFYREAKALLAVRHPAVVHCHDLLSDEAGRVYLIMEMIEGIPLSKKMNDGPLSPDDVAVLGARVSHGLSAAHRKGVIHRDVSPDNVVLPNGRVQEAKLIDFGIAKILQEGEGTIIDGFKGKLSYASPEQLGFFSGKIDGRSDFYSLGLVLIAAALGRPLGMGTTVMEAVDARRSFDSLPDEIPIGLRSAIAPLLALDPEDRPKYIDRLFVVPGGVEGATDPGRYATAPATRRSKSGLSKEQTRLFAGIAAGALFVTGGGLYLGLGGDSTLETAIVTPGTSRSAPIEEPPVAPVPNPVVQIEPAKPEPAAVVAEVKPEKPRPRKLTASDLNKISGKLINARLALADNRLMSPANDNAYDRYRQVLALDPGNTKAKDGLRAIADRYLRLTDSAVGQGILTEARTYLARAKKADPTHPGIAATESALSR